MDTTRLALACELKQTELLASRQFILRERLDQMAMAHGPEFAHAFGQGIEFAIEVDGEMFQEYERWQAASQ